MFVAAFAMGFSPGALSIAWTDTAISGVFGLQGSLFGVLGEWTLGAGADVSVSCVVSEPESDWDSFPKKSCRSGQQRCKMWADCILLWDFRKHIMCANVFRKISIDRVLECSCAKMSFVHEAVEQLHAVRFSSLQSASDCGRDRSLAGLSLVLAKAGLRDLERSPRRLFWARG